MEIIPFLLFVLSTGVFAYEKFRSNRWAVFFAGTIATLSSVALLDEGWNYVFHRPEPTITSPSVKTPAETIPIEQRATAPPEVQEQRVDPNAIELAFWQSLDKNDIVQLRDYVRRFPSGQFTVLAERRIKSLLAPHPNVVRVAPRTSSPTTTDDSNQDHSVCVNFNGKTICDQNQN